MAKGYQQLTYEQRCQISALKTSGQRPAAIAAQLGVHRSTICRELKRNTGLRGYRYKQAHEKCLQRRKRRDGEPRKMTHELVALIEEKLTQYQWSPEQISGWLKQENDIWISHESLYRHIWRDKAQGGRLFEHLRRRAKRYQKRGANGKTSRGQIVGRVDIDQRPAIVEARSRVGDWEVDTVIGLGRTAALVTIVERMTRYTLICRVSRNTSLEVTKAIIRSLSGLPVRTLTFDNGKEFSDHLSIAQALQADTYFAKPYHSWERGLNENTNGLIRQYFPKKTDFNHVTDAQVKAVEDLLNHRPRKCLGYNTPFRAIQAVA